MHSTYIHTYIHTYCTYMNTLSTVQIHMHACIHPSIHTPIVVHTFKSRILESNRVYLSIPMLLSDNLLETGHGDERGIPHGSKIHSIPLVSLKIAQVQAREWHEDVVQLDGVEVFGVLRVADAVSTEMKRSANFWADDMSALSLLRLAQPVVPILVYR